MALAMRTTTSLKLAKVQQGEKGFRHHYSRVSFISSIVLLLFKLRLRPSDMRLPSLSNSSLALHTEKCSLVQDHSCWKDLNIINSPVLYFFIIVDDGKTLGKICHCS